MRDFLVFLAILAIIFFGIGEWRGWHLGVPSQTPVFVYKIDSTAQATRRTINRSDLPVKVTGRVRNGSVTVSVVFEDVGSFQSGTRGRGERDLFEETYREGQLIAINQTFDEGRGIYRVTLTFENATGVFQVELPVASQL